MTLQNRLIAHVPSHPHQLQSSLGRQFLVLLLGALLRVQAGIYLKVQSTGRSISPIREQWLWGDKVIVLPRVIRTECRTDHMLTDQKFAPLCHG